VVGVPEHTRSFRIREHGGKRGVGGDVGWKLEGHGVVCDARGHVDDEIQLVVAVEWPSD
jgi:hypothetical protein